MNNKNESKQVKNCIPFDWPKVFVEGLLNRVGLLAFKFEPKKLVVEVDGARDPKVLVWLLFAVPKMELGWLMPNKEFVDVCPKREVCCWGWGLIVPNVFVVPNAIIKF